jgi:hypothetical protein
MKGFAKIYQKVFANVSTLDQIFLHVYKIKAMRNDKTVSQTACYIQKYSTHHPHLLPQQKEETKKKT